MHTSRPTLFSLSFLAVAVKIRPNKFHKIKHGWPTSFPDHCCFAYLIDIGCFKLMRRESFMVGLIFESK